MNRPLLPPGLLLLASGGGCASIIGADFDDLRRAPLCDSCGAGSAQAGRGAGGKGGRGGSADGGSGGSSGGSPSVGGSAATGTGGSGAVGGLAGEAGWAGEAGAPTVDPCASHAECIDRHDGQPYVCRRSTCVKVTTDDCPLLLPSGSALEKLRSASPILVGGFADVGPPYFGDVASVNWDLAFTEYHAMSGDLGSRRPLVALVCNSNVPDILPAFWHLGVDLGIDGLLSTLSPEKLLAAYQETDSGDGTTTNYLSAGGPPMFVLAGAADPRVANLHDSGLVWHMLDSPRGLATATAGLVRHIEPRVVAQRDLNHSVTAVDGPGPLRVTLVTADALSFLDAETVLTAGALGSPSELTFNGQLAVRQPESFRRAGIDAAEEILQHPPHIVVVLAGAEAAGLIQEVELRWEEPGTPQGFMRPYWVLYDGAAHQPALPGVVASLEHLSPPPSERLVGVTFAGSEEPEAAALNDAYESRLLLFNRNPALVPALSGTGVHYDAAYALIYSYAAASAIGGAVIATDLRDAFKDRVYPPPEVDAKRVDIGPSSVFNAMADLVIAERLISLYGTMGPAIFARSTGTRATGTSAWCLAPGNAERPYVYDALLYDPKSDTYFEPLAGPGPCAALAPAF